MTDPIRRPLSDEVKWFRDAADSVVRLAALPAQDVSAVREPGLPSAEGWARLKKVADFALQDEPRAHVEQLAAASARFVEAAQTWAFRQQVRGTTDLAVADAAYRKYLAERDAAHAAAQAVLSDLGSEVWLRRLGRWLKSNLTDPKSWSILLAAGGLVAFAVIRLMDLALYSPFGVDPDEVGRDSVATVPHAVILLIAVLVVASFALGVVSLVVVWLAMWAAKVRGWRDKWRKRPSSAGAGDAAPAEQREDPLVIAAVLLATLALVGLFLLWLVVNGQAQIEACRSPPVLAFAIEGRSTAVVVSVDPPLPPEVASGNLAYLGTGPHHVVLYDCDRQQALRLPKGVYTVVVSDPSVRRPPP